MKECTCGQAHVHMGATYAHICFSLDVMHEVTSDKQRMFLSSLHALTHALNHVPSFSSCSDYSYPPLDSFLTKYQVSCLYRLCPLQLD